MGYKGDHSEAFALENMVLFDWENIKEREMPKTKEQEIMRLQKLLLLEKKNPVRRRRWRDESVSDNL